MRYIAIVLAAMLWGNAALAHVANVTAQGTTVYNESGNVYTPRQGYYPQLNNYGNTNNTVVNEVQPRYEADTAIEVEQMKNNPLLKIVRSPLKNNKNNRMARNLLVLQQVADYKIGDEKLKSNINEVKESREYQRKMNAVMEKLSNGKIANSKNKEVLRILDEAGNKIYNLLAN